MGGIKKICLGQLFQIALCKSNNWNFCASSFEVVGREERVSDEVWSRAGPVLFRVVCMI